MKVSVVICTYNRAQGLIETLNCLKYQSYRDFEVVVVNGPSTDNSEEVLAAWAGLIRHERCYVPNLSMSRNVGIRAAGGDLVAFIDDDALPDFSWLADAVEEFEDPVVCGVGGLVFDHTGMALQYKFSAANRFAEATMRSSAPYDEQSFPGSFEFPYLQGTNAIFRRTALLEVGGFDETFDYYLDETDLCCRLIDAGFMLRQLSNAAVHHKFLPSGIRDHQRVVTNWFPIVKNHVYFSYRHGLDLFGHREVHARCQRTIELRVADAYYHEQGGRLPAGTSDQVRTTCAEALSAGIVLGTARRELQLGPVDWPGPRFHRYDTVDSTKRRRFVLVCDGYTGNMTGGISRFISELAPALAQRGHEVRVLTKSHGQSTVDLEEGVWVHRLETVGFGADGVAPATYAHINSFATSVALEVDRICEWTSIDLLYGPLWDVEVIGALTRTAIPIVVEVATPVAVTASMTGVTANLDAQMAELMRLEAEVLGTADLFHANSLAVMETVTNNYPIDIDPSAWQVVPLGLKDRSAAVGGTNKAGEPGKLTVLFVGRFETRKGIDTFLEAVSRVAPNSPNVHFVAAGQDRSLFPGEELFGKKWLELHGSEPWIDRVAFPGEVSDDELHQLYASSDIVVLPSRYESFGLVVVEAMMHGRAIVTCATSGINEVAEANVDAILIEPGSTDELERSVRLLLSDGPLRQKLGTAARKAYVDKFTVDAFAERFEFFTSRILALPVANPIRRREVVGQSAHFPSLYLADGEEIILQNPEGNASVKLSVRAKPNSPESLATVLLRKDSMETTSHLVGDSVRRLDVMGPSISIIIAVSGGELEILNFIASRSEQQ